MPSIPAETYQKIVLVIERLREGDTLNEACRKVGIARITVRRNLEGEPELQAMFDEALDDCLDVLADKLINIDSEVSDPKMAGVLSKNYQWFLSKKRPDRYGDKMIVEMTGGIDKEIVDLMRAAVARIPLPAAPSAPPMIDLTPLVEDHETAILDALLG